MKLKFCSVAMLLVSVLLVSSTCETSAYVLKDGWTLSNPSNVTYSVSSTAGQYGTMLSNYSETWETYCDEIGISPAYGDENIYFYAEVNYNNGKYATTMYPASDSCTITFYYAFSQATSIVKYETIVHEVGHALGLEHCQTEKEDISVMRALGFNGKPYPLEDDIEGISAKY